MSGTFFSLITQRLLIGFVSKYIAPVILAFLFTKELLATPLFIGITPGLIFSSFIVVFFLGLGGLWKAAKDNLRKYKTEEDYVLSKFLVDSFLRPIPNLLEYTVSMMLVGPEINAAISLFGGVPIVGDTVIFMEEFVYGAKGTEGVGTMILNEAAGTFIGGAETTLPPVNPNDLAKLKNIIRNNGTKEAGNWLSKMDSKQAQALETALAEEAVKDNGVSALLSKTNEAKDEILQAKAEKASTDVKGKKTNNELIKIGKEDPEKL